MFCFVFQRFDFPSVKSSHLGPHARLECRDVWASSVSHATFPSPFPSWSSQSCPVVSISSLSLVLRLCFSCCLLCPPPCVFLVFCLCFFVFSSLLFRMVFSRVFRLARGGVSLSIFSHVLVCLSRVWSCVCLLSRLSLAFPCLASYASACPCLLTSHHPACLLSSLVGGVLVLVLVLRMVPAWSLELAENLSMRSWICPLHVYFPQSFAIRAEVVRALVARNA